MNQRAYSPCSCVAPLIVLVGLLASPAWTDVLPPPSIEIYFDNLDKFPDYTFFLFPTDIRWAFLRVGAGKPFRFFQGFTTNAKLYAVKGPLPEGHNDPIFSDSTVPRSDRDLRLMGDFRQGGVQKFHYRITAIEAGIIKLKLVSQGFSPEEYHPYHPVPH